MNIAMILAGGVGSRVNADCPKQFIEVLGKPILAYTIEIYQQHSEIDTIEIVCHSQWISYLKNMKEKYNLNKVKWIVEGGETFLKSVTNGIEFLSGNVNMSDNILIHYGAAPFTEPEIITDAIKVCNLNKVGIACTPCYQLMGSNDRNKTSRKWIDRDDYVQIACPQAFRYEYILELYDKAKKRDLLNNVEPHITSVMYELGETIYQSYSNQSNIKITTRDDMRLFEIYARGKCNAEKSL